MPRKTPMWGMLALDQVLWKHLVMFDQFWDFDRLVKDGAPGEAEIAGSHPFCDFLGLGFM
jgi:hypothetical protein